MTSNQLREFFHKQSLKELAAITGIPSDAWCRWFRGIHVTEKSLHRAAEGLGTTPGNVLDLIQERRSITRKIAASGRIATPTEYRSWQQKEFNQSHQK